MNAKRTRLIRAWVLDDEDLARLGCGKPVENSGSTCGKLALACGLFVDRAPMLADREGLLGGRPAWIWRELFSYFPDVTLADVDRILDELDVAGYVRRYEVEGEPYIQLVTFEQDQRPHKTEARSRIPGPENADDAAGANLRLFDSRSVTSRVTSHVTSRPGDSDNSGDASSSSSSLDTCMGET